ncbi:hypothetical protein T265_10871 [Opisthorchis viverrini]|uniref:EF-hand domain-containing protein n=1 Tax=Opisthorchis viverrini TaxID=6198 RepID=A0A074ZBL2_OPIVI|nr:hypothetical protein T265_10871 [Opisthorchis viverrini]KER20615.1 hypothetical protein T265_10871 [Opisthorchis viverrini]
MCHGISAQQLEELFQSLDRDGNGSVDREELAVSLKEAGIPGKNAEHSGVSNGPYIGCTTLQLFTHTKVPRQQNFNRTLVSGSNFAALVKVSRNIEYRWKRLFVTLDSDRSGKVDKRELQQMFNEMGMHFALSTLEDWIADHDVDGDGKLTYQEFMGFVAEQIAQ